MSLSDQDIKKNRLEYLNQNRLKDKRRIIVGLIGVAIGGISLFIMYCIKHFELLK